MRIPPRVCDMVHLACTLTFLHLVLMHQCLGSSCCEQGVLGNCLSQRLASSLVLIPSPKFPATSIFPDRPLQGTHWTDLGLSLLPRVSEGGPGGFRVCHILMHSYVYITKTANHFSFRPGHHKHEQFHRRYPTSRSTELCSPGLLSCTNLASHIHIYTYIHIYIHIYIYTYIHIYIYTYIHIYIYTCIYIYIYVGCISVYRHVCRYTYTYVGSQLIGLQLQGNTAIGCLCISKLCVLQIRKIKVENAWVL